jgi:hypothetical protein
MNHLSSGGKHKLTDDGQIQNDTDLLCERRLNLWDGNRENVKKY